MSQSFDPNQQWNGHAPYQQPQPQLQLETEFGYPIASQQRHGPQQSATYPDYQFSSTTMLASDFNPSYNAPYAQSRSSTYPTGDRSTDSSFANEGYRSTLNHQNLGRSFDSGSSYIGTTQQQQQPNSYHTGSSLPYSSRPNISPSNSGGISSGNSQQVVAPFLSSSPPPMGEAYPAISHTLPQQPNYQVPAPNASTSSRPQKQKRPRAPDQADDPRDDEGDGDGSLEPKDKIKPGACARCKNLKVRCEFKTDTDPCKRCLNGGHDCVIPGRKKRRTPPKREHLLSQIREQAEEIQKLMSKLEETNKRQPHLPTSATSQTFSSHSQSSLHSPVLSPSSTHTSSYFDSEAPPESTNKAVEDWIAKARESLNDFGGFIGIGGAGMPRAYIVEEDPEDSPSSDDDYGTPEEGESQVGEGEYDFAVVDSDGEEWNPEDSIQRRTSRQRSNASSAGSNHTRPQPRKKDSGTSAKLATLPSEAAPFGLMAGLSLRKHKQQKGGSVEPEVKAEPDDGLGVANDDFFRTSPAPDPRRTRIDGVPHAPHILSRGIITPTEAESLFKIFFDNMNLSLSLVDPVLYTAERTVHRSSFLFTVICAISSRFYTARPELYSQAMHYAQLAAGTALISGPKNVELCIGYLLLSLYPVPSKRWEDARGWLYLGLAIRIATDLNLHLPNTAKPQSENHAREQLNRTRVWLNLFNVDRSTGSQYGKPPIISNLDYTANHCEDWWRSSPYNMPNFDIHLVVYNASTRCMGRFRNIIYSDPNHPTGLNKDVDFEQVATETDEELQQIKEKWFAILAQTDVNDPTNRFRTGLLRLQVGYARLIALSFGFQHAFGKNNTDENPFLMRCLNAAFDVVHTFVHDVGRPEQRIYVRHGPEAQSVFVTFASSFLVKLLQPKFSSYLTEDKRVEIRGLVQSVIDHLGSADVALDDRHGPKLYARFLKGLLNAPMAKGDQTSASGKGGARAKSRRPKSASSNNAHDPFYDTPPPVDHGSPATAHSLSPPPSQAALSFDQFAPPAGGLDPFAPVASIPGAYGLGSSANGLDMNVSMDFFNPPLPFDSEILQSMQSLADQNNWQDVALPSGGLDWMAQFQSPDAHLDPNAQYMSQ